LTRPSTQRRRQMMMATALLSAKPYGQKYFRACSRLRAFDAPNRVDGRDKPAMTG
jgi:hypothetical protein